MTCPRCGTENPAGNRFCMKCGADMTATAPAEASSAGASATGYSYTAAGTETSGASAPGTQEAYRGTQEAYSGGDTYNANAGSIAYGAAPQFAPPPSSYGTSPNMGIVDPAQLVGFGPRFVATIIDALVLIASLIVVGIVAAILGAIHLGALGGLLIVLWYIGVLIYRPYFWVSRNGQTIGHKAMHIRVVKLDGGPISVGTAIARLVGYAADGVILGIGYLWCLWDAKKQCVHDKIADTVVVRA